MKIKNAAKGLVGLLGVGALALGMSGEAEASIINIYDRTSASIEKTDLALKNIDGAIEGLDGNDGPYLNPVQSDALEIYTKINGNRYAVDARTINTLGWDFYLGVKGGPLTCNNFLKFEVADPTDLNNDIFAYDTANPGTKYNIPKDGSLYQVNLPNLVNQPAGEYAHWRLDINNVPEPSTGALAAMGALAGAGYAGSRMLRGRNRKKELREGNRRTLA